MDHRFGRYVIVGQFGIHRGRHGDRRYKRFKRSGRLWCYSIGLIAVQVG